MSAIPHGLRRAIAVATSAALLSGSLASLAVTPAHSLSPAPALVVTEIAPDVTGVDLYEFVEVHNPTSSPVDLSTMKLAYIYADSDDRTKDVALGVPPGTTIAPGERLVLWVDYTSSTVDTATKTEQDFRDFWAANGQPGTAYRVVRMTGQPGLANGGARGIRISDATGTEISRSYYPAGTTGINRTAHFDHVPATTTSMTLTLPNAVATPGAPSPTPTPTATPTPSPSATPTTVPTPTPTPTPTPPARNCTPAATSLLQITELVVDSANVGGSDGYEFIEVTNTSDKPVAYADFHLNYLYPLEDLTNSSVAAWPARPADPVIQPGASLVLWIKNGPNDALTAADFNAYYKTTLAAGTQLVEVHTGGMANGSPRGLEIVTNTGTPINRAYYNLAGADDVDLDRGIQYATDPADPLRQRLIGKAPATPGATTPEQTPLCVATPADTTAPAVTDSTASDIAPGQDFTFSATITDDVAVRTVTLWTKSDVDQAYTPTTVAAGPDGTYRHTVAAADLTGKRHVDHYWTAGDGTHLTTSPTTRSTVTGVDTAPLGLSVVEGQCLRGTTTVSADGRARSQGLRLSVAGHDVTGQATPTLGGEPVFAMEAGSVDTFFKNGILVGPEVLKIFEDGIYSGTKTISTPVPLKHVRQGDELVVSVYAGTKAKPAIDPNENNDDFTIQNLRLVLPDGRTLTPTNYTDPTRVLQMGDSAGKLDFFDAHFTLPADAFTAVGYAWDTTTLPDGTYPVTATNGTDTLTRQVCVDNTGPVIDTPLVDGKDYQGPITLTATATDAGAGVERVSATLDGQPVTLPHDTSSVQLSPGEHTFVVTATDKVGNTSTRTVRFTTPVEQPGVRLEAPEDFGIVPCTPAELAATVVDPSGDQTAVSFLRGTRLVPGVPQVGAYEGRTRIAAQPDRTDATRVGDPAALAAVDQRSVTTESSDQLPYQLFEVAAPADAGPDHQARIRWTGAANANSRVVMSVMNTRTGQWENVAQRVTGSTAPFTLEAMVPATDHARDGRIQVLVQHSVGYAGENLSGRDTAVTPAHPDDTPRSAYDFTFGWESDTQYYNANDAFYKHQLGIHDYFLDRRAELNLQYVFHTGDIVDNNLIAHQYENADPAYAKLDQARLPYGVLAGNHDVSHQLVDYTQYGQHFGEARYAGNPWYGGSHQNNRGHYDLLSAGGMDFVMLYMGWGPGNEQIAWMNDVIRRFPERKVMINLHEYMLTTGGLGPIPQRVFDEVVRPNPNVITVFSGHYHDAYHRTDALDDNGDGTPDRTVHSVLFDYQGLPEGGQGYLRLMHFDNPSGQIVSRTYSPTLADYDSSDPNLEPQHQEFTIPYADLGLAPATKSLSTDALSVDVLTAQSIATFPDVASGTRLTATWADVPAGSNGWYVVARDPHGGVTYSDLRTLRRGECGTPGTPPASPLPDGHGPSPTRPADGSPAPQPALPGERPAPAPKPADPGVRPDRGGLAATGASDATPALAGLLALLSGAALVRRRR